MALKTILIPLAVGLVGTWMGYIGAWHLRFGPQSMQRRGWLLFIAGVVAWLYACGAFLEWRFSTASFSLLSPEGS